ncbi:hypothetical protein ABH926_005077 [Catenulispora sp. GP43]|uniref:DUF3024 domain-containing protein n=1 Tax=Catenulispora sp. GP43 TaxID=3156263 RepID=UPI00351921B2
MTISQPDQELVAAWCEQRVPAHVRDQVAVGFTMRGASITLIERRAPWDGVGEWTARPFAQLRRSGSVWRLYWPDRNTRWHLRDEFPATSDIQTLLDIVADPRSAFE